MTTILGATTGSFEKLKALSVAAQNRPLVPMEGSAADRRENASEAVAPARQVNKRENA